MFVSQFCRKKLSVVVFGSPFLFFKFLIHFSRFPKILLAGVKRVKLAIKCSFFLFMIGLINTWLYNYVWSGSKVWSRNQVIQSPTYWSFIDSWIQICSEINLVCCFYFLSLVFLLKFGLSGQGAGIHFMPAGRGACFLFSISWVKISSCRSNVARPKSWYLFLKFCRKNFL